MAEDEQPKGPRTEMTVREYDRDGELIRETTTTIQQLTPKADSTPPVGGYL